MTADATAPKLRFLRPGARVQVIAPSGPFIAADLVAGVEALRARYDVRYEPGVFEREGYLAGSDERRLAELRAALLDDAIEGIFAARGGYGATRLLPELPVPLVAAHPKLLVGFSDITALHALWARAGLGSIHGPMVAALGRAPHAEVERFMRAVEGELPRPLLGLRTIAGGRASGPLAGGNLAVLTALCGTPHAPALAGRVLFLEDIGERPYRVDRMLTTLKQAGMLEGLAGIALGAFTDAAAGVDGVTIDEVLHERLHGLGVPVVSGVSAGHVDDNLPLPLGARVTVDAGTGSLSFEERP